MSDEVRDAVKTTVCSLVDLFFAWISDEPVPLETDDTEEAPDESEEAEE